MNPEPRILLYRRAECHACDRAAEAIRSIAAALNLPWQTRCIDGDEDLEARHGRRIPVVSLQRGDQELELAAEQVNAAALARRLRAALTTPRPD